MSNKFKMSSKSSKRLFTRSASSTRSVNTMYTVPMRGGFRF